MTMEANKSTNSCYRKCQAREQETLDNHIHVVTTEIHISNDMDTVDSFTFDKG